METADYKDILSGTKTFKSDVVEKNQTKFDELGAGQSPKITFLTCSDSRIDPCLLTGTDPGDLFVIRNAGNIVPSSSSEACGELASLEFAIKALGTKHVVVCGHSDCGAMKGVLAPEKVAGTTFVGQWVAQAKRAKTILEENSPGTSPSLEDLIDSNVLLQIENLKSLDFIKAAEENGEIQLHGWVYDIGTGDIKVVYDSPES